MLARGRRKGDETVRRGSGESVNPIAGGVNRDLAKRRRVSGEC
jgi:hypothetical protein